MWLQGSSVRTCQLLDLRQGQAFDACICRMSLQRHLRVLDPLAQGLGVNGQQVTTVGQWKQGHVQNSFQREPEPYRRFPGSSQGIFPGEYWEGAPATLSEM